MSDPRILQIVFTRDDGVTAPLRAKSGQSVVVGREAGCDLRLEGRKLSRRHLRVDHAADGRLLLVDNNSHNGTLVNGARVREAALAPGDVVTAGEWEGRVELLTPASPASLPRTMPVMMPAIQLPALQLPAVHGSPVQVSSVQVSPVQVPTFAPGAQNVQIHIARNLSGARHDVAVARSGHDLTADGSPIDIVTHPERAAIVPQQQQQLLRPSSDWRWDEARDRTSTVPPDLLRVARVEDNPIVKRLTETQSALDFRGLSELPQLHELERELAPGNVSNVDALALRLVFKVTDALAHTESMDAFLREMTESLCDAARAKACIVLLPDEHGALQPRIVKLRRAEEKVQISRTILEHAVSNRASLATEDAGADERFANGDSVLRFDLKAVLVVPLMKERDVIGALYMTRDLPFSNTDRDLVAALAQLIAMGLERSRLREEIVQAERQRRTLERFHAPEVVRRLMMENHAPVSARGDGLFLEPLTASVLFCDLSGFTSFCEAHDAEQVGRLLNAYLGSMTEIVFAHGGTVDKYIGDAIMCIFGAPFMADDDALRCVRCAVEMRRRFRVLALEAGVGVGSVHALDVHIGVNTGSVVAGTVGSPLRMEYTALGDTVNTAARLEGVARKGEILIGRETAALVHGSVRVVSRGVVSLKGKSEPVEVYEVPDDEATTTVPAASQ